MREGARERARGWRKDGLCQSFWTLFLKWHRIVSKESQVVHPYMYRERDSEGEGGNKKMICARVFQLFFWNGAEKFQERVRSYGCIYIFVTYVTLDDTQYASKGHINVYIARYTSAHACSIKYFDFIFNSKKYNIDFKRILYSNADACTSSNFDKISILKEYAINFNMIQGGEDS